MKRRILFFLIMSHNIAGRKRYRCFFAILLTKTFNHFGSILGLIKDKRFLSTISWFPFLHKLLPVGEYLWFVATQEKSIVNVNDYQNNILAYEFNICTRIRSASLETKVYKAFVEQLVPLKGYLFKTIDGLSKAIDLWLLTLHYKAFWLHHIDFFI